MMRRAAIIPATAGKIAFGSLEVSLQIRDPVLVDFSNAQQAGEPVHDFCEALIVTPVALLVLRDHQFYRLSQRLMRSVSRSSRSSMLMYSI